MKTLLTVSTVAMISATGLQAANLALSGTYAYTSGPMPQFSGGTYYFDDGHAGNTVNGAYDSGDLNNDIFFASGAPTSPTINTVVAWNPVSTGDGDLIPSEITFDLGTQAEITSVTVFSYIYTSFALGAPDDFTLSFSSDNVSYTPASSVNTNFTYTTGEQSVTENISQTARYVRLSFDGDTVGGDKYSLTEIQIEGTAIPEPSSLALLGLGSLALLRRRR
ncbi:hypothetical protein Rhal01_00943 [Rubritalea halochordaticola]|uniref:PEP-CTERM sorting domain-containing protein n=1 Tax=Rubritalea halochordaticola TaxID=714537 RepID=A0ABP9UZJ0_9BACT